jgi:adenylyltransferase/sulfurtransferase
MVSEITARALSERLARNEPTYLLDVRQPWEFELGALPDAVLVPLDQLPARAHEIKLPDGALLVTVCHHGVRSLHAAMFLARNGHPGVQSLAGGTDAWSREIDPGLARY